MGQVKSTMDLVMERTKHLSMSEEEKEQQKKADFEKRLNGLLTKYSDQAMPLNVLEEEIAALKDEFEIADAKSVVKTMILQIDPDRNNKYLLDLLAKIDPEVLDPLEKVLDKYNQEKKELLENSEQQVLERLAENHGIAGSAVIPNPEKDPLCKQALAKLRNQAKEECRAAV